MKLHSKEKAGGKEDLVQPRARVRETRGSLGCPSKVRQAGSCSESCMLCTCAWGQPGLGGRRPAPHYQPLPRDSGMGEGYSTPEPGEVKLSLVVTTQGSQQQPAAAGPRSTVCLPLQQEGPRDPPPAEGDAPDSRLPGSPVFQ